jgi:glycine/D-amino acid oxidase-like deaminating enzyme
VVVLDAHPVGWGASTRNGGMVIPELKAGPAALERVYGPLGRRMYAEVNEAFDHVESLVAGAAPAIACDYARTGQLYLAHSARRVAGLAAMAREHGDELGEPVRFVPREALSAEIGSFSLRSRGVVRPQASNASAAAPTAASTSVASLAGTWVMTSPVAGSITSSVAPDAAGFHAPPMK